MAQSLLDKNIHVLGPRNHHNPRWDQCFLLADGNVSSSRKTLSESGGEFWRLNNNGQESWDGAMFAGYIVGAIFFSIASIATLAVMLMRD